MKKITNTNDVEDLLSDIFGMERSEVTAMIFDSVIEAMLRAFSESRPSLFCTVSVAKAETEYAALIGKDRSKLSESEKRVAVFNAVIEASEAAPP